MSTRATLTLSALLLAGAAAFLWAQPAGRDADPRPPKASSPGEGDVRPAAAVNEQQEAELLGALADKRPDEARRLRKLKEENPREYRFALVAAWKQYQTWKDLPPEVQKMFASQQQARLDAWRVSRDFFSAKDPNQKERIRARLMEILGVEFDAEQGVREFRLGQLEDQLKRLRAELRDRADRRAQVIEQNLQDLLASKSRPKGDGDLRRPLEGRPFAAPPTSRPAGPHPPTRPAE